MKETNSSPAEINSIDNLNKKRKLQVEMREMPLPKHVCWGQNPGVDFSLNHSREQMKVESDKFGRGESDPESAKDSNSFHCNGDSIMSMDDETKTNHEYLEICASDEPSTLSSSWAATSSEISLYSSESKSFTKSSSSQTESLSITEQFDIPHYQFETHPSLIYEGELVEFGSLADCSCSEYRNDGAEECVDKELENLLVSNEIAPGNYVLSSGRWSVNQGADTQQEGKKKLTIDKEFEQYFSMLMM